MIKEAEVSIAVFSKKVYEKYPGGTIERRIGELITKEDMQYPLNGQEVSNEYTALSNQVSNVSH